MAENIRRDLFIRELALLHEFRAFYIRDGRAALKPNSLTPLKPHLLRFHFVHSNHRMFSSMYLDALRPELAEHDPAETPLIAQQWAATPEGVLAAEEAQRLFHEKVDSYATASGHVLLRHLSNIMCTTAQTISRHTAKAEIDLTVDYTQPTPARYIAVPDIAMLIQWELPGTPLSQPGDPASRV